MFRIVVNTPKSITLILTLCISIHSFSDSTLDMDPIFGAISAVDHADCGKLLVCNVFAKVHNELTTEEDLLGSLFKNVNRKSDPWHPKAQYILAAKIGSQRSPNMCTKQYHKCPYHPDQLSTLLKKQ